MRVRGAVLWVLVLLALPLWATPPNRGISVTLSSAWATVPLPDMPLGIAVHGGAFWVCGANEMIARSRNDGHTWQILHEKAGGEMLFTLAFTGADTVQAFGTAGVRVISADGGSAWEEKWISRHEALIAVQFVSVQVGYGITPDGIGRTKDGGKTWHFWQSKAAGRSFVALAALDADQAAFLGRDNAVELTSDGGKHWRSDFGGKKFDWSGLRVVAGAFHLFGERESDHADLMAEHVSGSRWTAQAVPWDYGDCGRQGCRVSGGWADLSGTQPVYWAWPRDKTHPLTGAWAVQGSVACRISDVLRCRIGRQPLKMPISEPHRALTPAKLLKLRYPSYSWRDRQVRAEGTVFVQVLVGSDGRVHAAVLEAASTLDMAMSSLRVTKDARFRPALADGVLTPAQAELRFTFRLH